MTPKLTSHTAMALLCASLAACANSTPTADPHGGTADPAPAPAPDPAPAGVTTSESTLFNVLGANGVTSGMRAFNRQEGVLERGGTPASSMRPGSTPVAPRPLPGPHSIWMRRSATGSPAAPPAIPAIIPLR